MNLVLLGAVGLVWIWSMLALRYLQLGGAVVRFLIIGFCLAQPFLTTQFAGVNVAIPVTVALALPVAFAWRRVAPQLDLDWAADQARLPYSLVVGDAITINNVRNARYRSTTDFEVIWETRHYNARELRTVDYIVEPFGSLHGMAHTFLSFGFDDGKYVAVSVEVRRERPEIFGPIKGVFRQYELMYVIGDERDLIGLRANVRRDSVYVYPTRASRDQVRSLFLSMLERANALAKNPEFYNTLTNNCATNILGHVNALVERPLPFSLRVAIPGYSAKYAYDRGLIEASIPFRDAKAKYRINDRSAFDVDTRAADEEGAADDGDGAAWSAQIRETGDAR